MKKVSKILLGSILCILMITLGFGFNSQAAIDCTITFDEGEGGPDAMIFVFRMLSFKSAFSLSSFI